MVLLRKLNYYAYFNKESLRVLLFLFYKMGGFLSCYLPSFLSYWIAERLADFFFLFARGKYIGYKRAISNNVALILDKRERERKNRKIALLIYRNFARYLREFLWLPKLSTSRFFRQVTPVGVENLDYALSKRKGTVLLSIHFGNWEWGGIGLALAGYKMNFLVRPHKNEFTNRLFNEIRSAKKIKVISINQLKQVIKALKRNEVVAILADEENKEGVKVDLFNQKVMLASGPFKLAYRMKALISPAFMIRDRKTGKQKGVVESPIEVNTHLSQEEAVRQAARKFARVMEDYLRYYPDHWLLLEDKKKIDITNG